MPKPDEEKIESDEKSPADTKGRSLAERNQKTLDFLRSITKENRPTNAQHDVLNTRLRVHPAFRLVAAKIIKEKNLTRRKTSPSRLRRATSPFRGG